MKLEITFPICVGLIDADETPQQLARDWAHAHGVLAAVKPVPHMPGHEIRVIGTPGQITGMFIGEPSLHSFACGDAEDDAETLFEVFASATKLAG